MVSADENISFMKKLILIVFVLFGFVEISNADTCKSINEVQWPDELLYYYFKTPGLKIIPFPSEICDFRQEIKFKNTQGQIVGQFKITSSIRHAYDDLVVRTKETPELIKLYHNSLIKNIKPIVFTDLIFKTLNYRFLDEINKDVLFVSGNFNGDPKLLTWNPYSLPSQHWNAVNIDYKTLIQMYLNKETEFVFLKGDEVFKFPKAKKSSSTFSNVVKSEVPDLIFLNNLAPIKDNKDIVLFSSFEYSIQAYNYLSAMSFKNNKKIYWFNDANIKWVDFKKKDYIARMKEKKIISGTEVLNLIRTQQNYKIADISADPYFSQLHFKNAVKTQVRFMSPQELRNYYAKSNQMKIYQSKNEKAKKYGEFVFSGLEKIPKNTSLIVTGNHNLDAAKTSQVYKKLSKAGYSKVSLLLEPLDEVLLQHVNAGGNSKEFFVETKPTLATIPEFKK